MLADRSYLRGAAAESSARPLTWLLCAIVAGFIVQVVADRIGHPMEAAGALSPAALRHGWIWTLVTYPLLHEGFWHLLFDVLGLYFLGREILPQLGARQFAALAISATVLAGVVWLALHFFAGGGSLMGATAIVLCFAVVFACLAPDEEMTFLLFFFLPVRLRPRMLAWAVLVVVAAGLVLLELPGTAAGPEIAFSSQLGGMAAGWFYYRYFHARHGWDRASPLGVELPEWLRRKPAAPPPPRTSVDASQPPENLRAEVDRILDKINSEGFGALTPAERHTLDQARDLLSRH